MPQLTLSTKSVKSLSADALLLAVASPEVSGTPVPGSFTPAALLGAETLPRATREALTTAIADLRVTGRAGQVQLVGNVPGVAASLVALTGVGPLAGAGSTEGVRRAVGAAVRTLAGRARVVVAVPLADTDALAAAAEGAALGAYAFEKYRPAPQAPVAEVVLVAPGLRDKAAKSALARAEVVGRAVRTARDLINTAPGDLAPADLAEAARRTAAGTKLKVRVLDEKQLAAGGYGGILGVGQGSSRPPRLVVLDHHPRGASAHLALVGKGITFDSGGLSLKPASGMETMKSDMSGAAAVLSTLRAVADLNLPIRVTGWLAIAENMPSGTAIRPSDVLTLRGGKTVEVLNTDAEGRLVLADALVAAAEEKPTHVVDVATLTGAQVVALGNRVSAVMGNDDAFRDAVLAAAERSGEQFWPMPLPAELRPSLDSTVADIANIGGRDGGMLTAGLFLKEFVGERPDGTPLPWAHLDIAGPSFLQGQAHGYTHPGGTGVAVRTMLALAEDLAQG
ncbi:leucyl aminopeptidase [Kineococcus gynurae]|uniref:Probable cytosol aminopeptidase n=1 Tax=Kineococcus gynurae TaxID=452979 RepID=A0ABV5LUJ2_9ACTN